MVHHTTFSQEIIMSHVALQTATPAPQLSPSVRSFANGLFRRFSRVDCISKAAILYARTDEMKTSGASGRALITSMPW
jgi:hypothetical protein